jgi:N-hydroxyarylamine O-acetyltransferase
MDIQAYLKRIHYHGSLAPTLATLRALHHAHLLAVPFENLDIPLQRPIVLDEARLFDKIVTRRRGGFCYELNGAFAALLRALGFDTQLLAARVFNGQGELGIEFDHMALLVQLEERWLADVGFGDSFREPLRLDERDAQREGERAYRIADGEPYWTYFQHEDGDWKAQYVFTLHPYQLADFAGGCHYHQTSPDSPFTRRRVCSRALPDGRVTLSEMKFIATTNGDRSEHDVASEAEYTELLQTHFDIVL